MGRLASIAYPPEASGPYFPTTISFEPVSQAEYGIPPGHWRQTISTGGARTVHYFDALWRVGLTRTFDAAKEGSTASVVETHYDPDGRKVFQSQPQRSIDPIGGSVPGTSWFYDGLGRILLQRHDSELGPLDTRTAYWDGFQRHVTDPRGFQSSQGFQVFDEPTEERLAWDVREISQGTGEYAFLAIVRDVFGKPTAVTRSGAWGGSGPASVTRSYTYDQYQRLCKTVEPESGATVQGYDAASNVIWRASGLGVDNSCDSAPGNRTISYGYDARDRLTSTSYGDGSPGISRGYTQDGLLSQITSFKPGTNTISWGYTYNNRRLLTNERYTWGDPNGWWDFSWSVDANGNVSGLTDPWGFMNYAPNAQGQPTQVSGYAYNVSYHPNGAIAGYNLANGISHSVSLNTRGLPQQWQDSGTVNDQYSYDRNGNVASISDQQQGVASRSMAYDGLDRLTQANGMWGAGSFSYDALDNMRRSTVGGRDLWHNYDGANRLQSVTGSQTIGFSYDANGNINARGSQQFNFDIGNRMTHAPGVVNSYLYDGHGRRNLVFFASGDYMHQAYTKDGKLRFAYRLSEGLRRHVYLGDKLIAETVDSGMTTFMHVDALGSPVTSTNQSGQVLTRTRYEPYGATAAGTNPTRIGFTGHVNDPDTGLVYMQQRYYEPLAGRFLSVDPVTTDAKTGSSFNRYVYGNNNPYRFKDPDGRFALPLIPLIIQAVATAVASNAGAAAVGIAGGVAIGAAINSPGNSGATPTGASEVKSPVIKPSDVAGKTAGEIGKLATDAGLKPKGPDPVGGKGAFVDPKTGEQRVLVHGDHAHVNDAAGNRLDVNGNKVPSNSPEAHLPVKPDPPPQVK